MSLTEKEVFGPRRQRRRKGPTPESLVLNACLKWLGDRHVFCWRNNTGAMALSDGGYIAFGHVGSADIIGLLPTGRFLAIECKSAKGRQSEDQREFQAHVERNGGVYILAHSLAEMVTEFRKEYALSDEYPLDNLYVSE
jgi:hypothetical protein